MQRRLAPGSSSGSPPLWLYGLSYVLWGALLYLCYQTFWIWRSVLHDVLGVVLWRQPSFEAVYLLSMAVVGMLLFGLSIGSEGYLRASMSRRGKWVWRLLGRFLGLGLVILTLHGAALALRLWMARSL